MLFNAGIVSASAGGDETWTPSILNPALHLDASDNATLFDDTIGGSLVAANGSIARWEDKSGNSRHATQSILSNRPSRKTGFVNGLDVVEFNQASSNRMSHPAPVEDPDNLTVAIVFRPTSYDIGGVLWSHGGDPTGLLSLSYEFGDLYWAMVGSGNKLQFLSHSLTPDEWYIVIATLNIPGNSHQLRVNGTLVGTNTYNFGAETLTGTVNLIGDRDDGSGPLGDVFRGQMSSVLLLNSTITTANAEKLEGYWAHTRGLTDNLPSDHPYKTVAP